MWAIAPGSLRWSGSTLRTTEAALEGSPRRTALMQGQEIPDRDRRSHLSTQGQSQPREALTPPTPLAAPAASRGDAVQPQNTPERAAPKASPATTVRSSGKSAFDKADIHGAPALRYVEISSLSGPHAHDPHIDTLLPTRRYHAVVHAGGGRHAIRRLR